MRPPLDHRNIASHLGIPAVLHPACGKVPFVPDVSEKLRATQTGTCLFGSATCSFGVRLMSSLCDLGSVDREDACVTQ